MLDVKFGLHTTFITFILAIVVEDWNRISKKQINLKYN